MAIPLDAEIAMATRLDDIFYQLTLVLRAVFDNDSLVATPELTAAMVPGWDSMANIRLFVEAEIVFKLRFSAAEVASLKSVGQLAALIDEKISRSSR